MRRIIVAAGMLVLIITIIVVGNVVVNRQCAAFKNEIYTISDYIKADNDDSAHNAITKAKENWHKKKAVISMFSNHEPLDEVTVSIDELSAAIDADENNKACIILANIIANIDRITEEQKIHIESFF